MEKKERPIIMLLLIVCEKQKKRAMMVILNENRVPMEQIKKINLQNFLYRGKCGYKTTI
jgi:hypothetical protein